MRIGLCLSGGGAKGSYQAGVIKALYDMGIKDFTSISGTSIGAINGYFVFTGNVEKLEYMWTNINEGSENSIQIVNNTVDNSELVNILGGLHNNSKEKTKFYVNYVSINNKQIKENVKDISTLDKSLSLDCIKYSSLLPFNPKGTLGLKEQFIKDVNENLYEGYNLDGGLVRNTLIEPLINDNLDKIIIIATRHDYILQDDIKSKIDENKLIVVRPKTILTSQDTLKFKKDFCEKMFKEGYDIGSKLNINN